MTYCFWYFQQQDCVPCTNMKPTAQAIADATRLPVYWIDIHDDGHVPAVQPELVREFHVRATPTLALARVVDGPKYERVAGWTGNLINLTACTKVVQRLTQP